MSRSWTRAVALLALAACFGGDPAPPPDPLPVAGATESPEVTFTTADGIELTGLLFTPPEATGVVVMAHQRGGSMQDWVDVADAATQNGMAAFPFNFRGYGGQQGERDTNLDVDLAAAVDAMREHGFRRVAIAGASMGATAALHHAATEELTGVAALSPATTFAGLQVRPRSIDEPVLLITANDDQPYRRDADFLEKRLPRAADLELAGDVHGTDLLDAHESVADHLVGFFRQRFLDQETREGFLPQPVATSS